VEAGDRRAPGPAEDAVLAPGPLADRARALALVEGFDLAGVASAGAPPELAALAHWAGRGYAGEMGYLSDQVARRSDLRVAFPWARSVLSVGLQYDTPHPYSTQVPQDRGWIARYAWGDDYHAVMKARLDAVVARLEAEVGLFRSKTYVDTGPVVERAYAAAAGLGAWGKNTCLLHPEHGSWFFLGEAVTDLEMEADAPRPDMCGSCTACLEACPTGALPAPYRLDSNRCISYWTIEHRGPLPPAARRWVGEWVFGCDVCQEVCPLNAAPAAGAHPELRLPPRRGELDLAGLLAMSRDEYVDRFRGSPMKRAGYPGLRRNAAVAMGNRRQRRYVAALALALADEDPGLRRHAAWSLGQIGGEEAARHLRSGLAAEADAEVRGEIRAALGG
jgi:epoxyqueuosine reductase